MGVFNLVLTCKYGSICCRKNMPGARGDLKNRAKIIWKYIVSNGIRNLKHSYLISRVELNSTWTKYVSFIYLSTVYLSV